MKQPELTIVIPTYNERDNIVKLVSEITHALNGIDWAIFFVDDNSQDGTIELLKSIISSNERVDGVVRKGKRGLSGAVLTGLLYVRSHYVAVMDADLQHDPKLIKEMLTGLHNNPAVQVVIASRYSYSTKVDGLNKFRAIGSWFLTYISRLLISKKLTDPMSGFFITRTKIFSELAPYLSHNGYKIMLDLVSGLPDKNAILEYPLIFRPRNAGFSKMDFRVLWELIITLIYRSFKNFLPRQFLSFLLIGLIGLSVHIFVLFILYIQFQFKFQTSQIAGTLLAILNNFLLNNYLTYQNLSLQGKQLIHGYLKYMLICAIGAFFSFFLAVNLLEQGLNWALCGCIGAASVACWNYTLSKFLTWGPVRYEILSLKTN